MRLDLKVQDKTLKEMKRVSSLLNQQGKFHFTKNELFNIFLQGHCLYFWVFPDFKVGTKGYLESPPHKKLEFFLTLVNSWNLLPIVTESSTLDVVKFLDMPLVSKGCVCD